MRYQVIDLKTELVVGTYKTRKKAHGAADKLDWEYGGYRYAIKEVVDTPAGK